MQVSYALSKKEILYSEAQAQIVRARHEQGRQKWRTTSSEIMKTQKPIVDKIADYTVLQIYTSRGTKSTGQTGQMITGCDDFLRDCSWWQMYTYV